MSTRTALRPQVVINAGDMSGNLTSQPTILSSMSMASYSLSWAGVAPVGTASVQVSNDFSLNASGQVENPGTWTTLVLLVNGAPSKTIPVSGNSDTAFIDVDQTAAYAIRLIYTATSGTGSLTAVIVGKVQ